MENNDKPKCPKCGKQLIKNGKRSGNRQRWKCKGGHYHVTEDAKINALKINAINFFIDFLKNSKDEINFVNSQNVKLNLRKTKFRKDKNPKLKFKEIKDIRNIKEIDSTRCFIIQINDDTVDLITAKLANSEIIFKNSEGSRIYTK